MIRVKVFAKGDAVPFVSAVVDEVDDSGWGLLMISHNEKVHVKVSDYAFFLVEEVPPEGPHPHEEMK